MSEAQMSEKSSDSWLCLPPRIHKSYLSKQV